MEKIFEVFDEKSRARAWVIDDVQRGQFILFCEGPRTLPGSGKRYEDAPHAIEDARGWLVTVAKAAAEVRFKESLRWFDSFPQDFE